MSDAATKQTRTAILLYGMLREYEACAPSFHRHVVAPNQADIFYFGPAQTDQPTTQHKGKHDIFGNVVENPKSQVGSVINIEQEGLQHVYGDALKATGFHHRAQDEFLAEANASCEPQDWLYKLNPSRIFSMFYNIQSVVKFFLEQEAALGMTYDTVIITRPDLAFYSPITAKTKQGCLHIPDGEGFDSFGVKHIGNAPVLYYKNVVTGDYIPGGRHIRFNDQIMVMAREDVELLSNLYDNLKEYMLNKAPASPESLLYLHLMQRGGLICTLHPEWNYEIYRKGMPKVLRVTDTGEICLIDRRHPAAIERRNKRPLMSLLRDIKQIYRRVKHRILR